jgi:hypothetical protein
MLEKLEEQLRLAKEYGFENVWVLMSLEDAGWYLSTIRTNKLTSGLPNGSGGHSNDSRGNGSDLNEG